FAVAISSSSLGGRHLDEVPHLIEHATERRMVGLDHDVLVILESERLERAADHRRMAAGRPSLQDPQLALPHRRQYRVTARFALAVGPSGWVSSHGRPPAVLCTESTRRRCRALSPRAAAW